MQTLGQGAQYKVTTDGRRVYKTLITLDESTAMFRSWGYGFLTRDLRGLAARTLEHANVSVRAVKAILETHPELAPSLGNPVIQDNLNYSQDKVILFAHALHASSRAKARDLIDQCIDLQLYFASYGFIDTKMQIGVNYGVNKNSRVVLIDLGELTFQKDLAVADTAARKWSKSVTYWAPMTRPTKHAIPLSLKTYYRKQMRAKLTPETITANWHSKLQPVVIKTGQLNLKLVQMLTPQDDQAYFELQNANAVFWKEFGNSVYKSIGEVAKSRLEHGNERFGIWHEGRLVGMIGCSTKNHPREAEIGIMLAKDATGHGYASAAMEAMTKYAKPRFDRVFAEVEPNNDKSINLLKRSGYKTDGKIVKRDWGKALVFESL